MNLKIMPSCKEASKLISEQLDHPLPFRQKILLKIHLVMCAGCVLMNRQITGLREIIGLAGSTSDELTAPPTSSLSEEVRARIKTLMRNEPS